MAETKTKATTRSVTDFLNAIEDDERRQDCLTVATIMRKATGANPRTLVETSVKHMQARG